MAMNNSVRRSLVLLETIADAAAPQQLRDLCAETGIPKSTALGMLRALADRRFVESGPDGYRLGVRAFEVGYAYLRGASPVGAAQAELENLAATFQVTAHFAVLDGADVLYLDKKDPPDAYVRLASAIGTRLKAHHTAVGQAQLATLSDTQVIAHVGTGPYAHDKGCRDRRALLARLADTRARGYACDDAETLSGVMCIAAPVMDITGGCCGAVGISYLKQLRAPSVEPLVAAVKAAAQRASQRLGGPAGRSQRHERA